MSRSENPKIRYERAVAILRIMATTIFKLESSYIRLMLLKAYARTEDGERSDQLTCDCFNQHLGSVHQRELILQGKNFANPINNPQPFVLFSRRPCLNEGGAVLVTVADSKHGENYSMVLVFDENLVLTAIRKDDIVGNDFLYRVQPLAKELSKLLQHDKLIDGVLNHGN